MRIVQAALLGIAIGFVLSGLGACAKPPLPQCERASVTVMVLESGARVFLFDQASLDLFRKSVADAATGRCDPNPKVRS